MARGAPAKQGRAAGVKKCPEWAPSRRRAGRAPVADCLLWSQDGQDDARWPQPRAAMVRDPAGRALGVRGTTQDANEAS